MTNVAMMYDKAALVTSKGGAVAAALRGFSDGVLRANLDIIEFDGADATQYFGTKLPKGAMVVGFLIGSDSVATTMSIGDVNAATLYGTGIATTSATSCTAVKVPTYTEGTSAYDYVPVITAGLGYRIGTTDGDEQLLATQAAATSGTVAIVTLYIL